MYLSEYFKNGTNKHCNILKYNNIEIYKIRKIHIINILQKITLKSDLFQGRQNSILAEIFRKSAKISVSDPPVRSKKGDFSLKIGVKKRENEILFHWFTTSYKKNAEKVKKNARGVMYVMEKFYFCNPKRRRYGTDAREGLSTGECSLKE